MKAEDAFLSQINNLAVSLSAASTERFGRVTRVVGMTIEAAGISAEIGSQCVIEVDGPGREIDAEVIGFDERKIVLMPVHSLDGIKAGSIVRLEQSASLCSVGSAMLGRVVDGSGEPIDGKGAIKLSFLLVGVIVDDVVGKINGAIGSSEHIGVAIGLDLDRTAAILRRMRTELSVDLGDDKAVILGLDVQGFVLCYGIGGETDEIVITKGTEVIGVSIPVEAKDLVVANHAKFSL